MKKTLLIIAGSALATAFALKAAPALSQMRPADTTVSIVRTADLDLSTRAGQRQLDRRLVSAAHAVCGDAADADLKGQNAERRCHEEVLAEARARAVSILAAKGDATIAIAARR